MPVSKIDPKVIFASEAPAQDAPAVFTNKTVGWGESRKNGGRPTIKQSNALQQETDLKILWLNENSVTPYDASIDYPVNAVTIKDGAFKIFNGSVWNLFLNKSSVGLNDVDNTSDLNKPVSTATQDSFDEIYENGACLPYDSTITYVLGSLVLRDGIIQKVVTGGTEPLIGNTDAVKVIDGNQTQKEINLYGGKKYDMPVGGYPLNSIVLLDSGGLVRSTISNNTNNPNTLLTGWVKTNAASQLFTEGGQTLQSVADEARPVTKGGTGATNAEDARANLDVYSQAEVDLAIDEAVTATIPDATVEAKGIVRLADSSDISNNSETAVVTPKNVAGMLVGIGSLAKGFRALFSARLTQMTGTNTSNVKTITCNITAHGLSVGDVVSVNYVYKFMTNDQRATDTVTITSVANANTFTFTSPQEASGSASAAACTLYYAIKNNYNVNSLAINSAGRYTISINAASGITGANFIPFIQATTADNSLVIVQPEAITSATSLTVRTFNAAGTSIIPQWLHIGVTQ